MPRKKLSFGKRRMRERQLARMQAAAGPGVGYYFPNGACPPISDPRIHDSYLAKENGIYGATARNWPPRGVDYGTEEGGHGHHHHHEHTEWWEEAGHCCESCALGKECEGGCGDDCTCGKEGHSHQSEGVGGCPSGACGIPGAMSQSEQGGLYYGYRSGQGHPHRTMPYPVNQSPMWVGKDQALILTDSRCPSRKMSPAVRAPGHRSRGLGLTYRRSRALTLRY